VSITNGVITATRTHEICAGHSVWGHEGKCAHLHGHNYKFHLVCAAHTLDHIGRVLDFSQIKTLLCAWLEENWDHKFLLWEQDPRLRALMEIDRTVVAVPFNPTAENMARHLVCCVGPMQLFGTGVQLVETIIEETGKCRASYRLHAGGYVGSLH